eukprot:759659-Hanusia_phi.AAC.1
MRGKVAVMMRREGWINDIAAGDCGDDEDNGGGVVGDDDAVNVGDGDGNDDDNDGDDDVEE